MRLRAAELLLEVADVRRRRPEDGEGVAPLGGVTITLRVVSGTEAADPVRPAIQTRSAAALRELVDQHLHVAAALGNNGHGG
ncbi:MAG TPA: hypothetical protein VNP94_02730 [Actinomycetota bacterium]|nr:hypothetical protein [Actinomycetota bacterium]